MNKNMFYQQADLLISILPYLGKETDLALHGGTAINFFVRDIPRLSVDIDLTYLKINSREEALKDISEKLRALSLSVSSGLGDVSIEKRKGPEGGYIKKLFVRRQGALVKIEPNMVIRGSLFDCRESDLCGKAEEIFGKFVSARTLSFAELYGGKICAALDRQHPRDVFDIMLLLRNEGITGEVRKAFLVYLISHNRPMSELLAPSFKDMRPAYESEFKGMTASAVRYEELESVRNDLVKEINRVLTSDERAFLLSFKKKEPEWGLSGVERAKNLPAVHWKLVNLGKMPPGKHKDSVDRVKRILERQK